MVEINFCSMIYRDNIEKKQAFFLPLSIQSSFYSIILKQNRQIDDKNKCPSYL
jgi:hypothetical protein